MISRAGFVVTLALVAACGTKGGAVEQRPPSGDSRSAAGGLGCERDPAPCPGTCNPQGYCEQDLGWGAEIRLPATRYVVMFRGRKGNMVEYSIYEFPSPFWVDKREMTNTIAQKCTTCGLDGPADDMPAQVTRDQAVAICAAAGKRLATNAEWEAAARGPTPCTDPAELRPGDPHCNTRPHPWVVTIMWDAFDNFLATLCDTVHIADCGAPTGPRPVADRPQGASPLGVQELIGNVSEWIADMEADEGLVKGGDWTTPGDEGNYSYISIGARAREKVTRPFGIRCVRGPVMNLQPRLKAGPWGPAQ